LWNLGHSLFVSITNNEVHKHTEKTLKDIKYKYTPVHKKYKNKKP